MLNRLILGLAAASLLTFAPRANAVVDNEGNIVHESKPKKKPAPKKPAPKKPAPKKPSPKKPSPKKPTSSGKTGKQAACKWGPWKSGKDDGKGGLVEKFRECKDKNGKIVTAESKGGGV